MPAEAAAARSERLHAAAADAAWPELAMLDWTARLPSGSAPEFVCLAGAVGGVPVGGGGATLSEAAARLAGEAAEVLAQAASPAIAAVPCDPAVGRAWGAGAPCLAAVRLDDGGVAGVPAAAVHVAPDLPLAAGAPPRSLGLAAGPDQEAARLAGLLELIERDAAAGWWQDGRRPACPDPQAVAAAAALAPLRAGAATARATTLLELAAAGGATVMAAVSREADGRGLAVGLKAALDPAVAARGAVVELMQMEIALEMARHRAARGTPTAGDRGALARAALDPDSLAAFAPTPARPSAAPGPHDLAGLVAALADRGVAVLACDLGAPGGRLGVARVFAPALRPMPGGGAPARPDAPGARAPLMG